jgi:hypothetical protein
MGGSSGLRTDGWRCGEAESLRPGCQELVEQLRWLSDARRESAQRAEQLARSLAEWEALAERLRQERDAWHVRADGLKQELADVRSLRRGAEARAELFQRESAEHRRAAERLSGECDQLRAEVAAVWGELATLRGSRLVRWHGRAVKMLVPAEFVRMARRVARRAVGKVRTRSIRTIWGERRP